MLTNYQRLTRRVGLPRPTILGVDEPSVIEDGPVVIPVTDPGTSAVNAAGEERAPIPTVRWD